MTVVIGVDPSATMLGYARCQPPAEDVTWIQGDASSLAGATRSRPARPRPEVVAQVLIAVGLVGHEPAKDGLAAVTVRNSTLQILPTQKALLPFPRRTISH
jgi:hypothetical protein